MNGLGVSRLRAAIARIDEANANDPRICCVDGIDRAYELVYSERMSATLVAFRPDSSDYLQIAARAQHLQRWRISRESYSRDRIGYLKWRNELKRLHAEKAGAIMRSCGYSDTEIQRTQSLVRKERLKLDEEAQALEDIACLVFLQHYFDEFAATQSDAKLVDIVRKTWLKMSQEGRDAAMGLPLSNVAQRIVTMALTAA